MGESRGGEDLGGGGGLFLIRSATRVGMLAAAEPVRPTQLG